MANPFEKMIGWLFKQGMQASGVTERLDRLDRKIDDRSVALMTEIERSRTELSSRIDRSRLELAAELRSEMAKEGRDLRKEMTDLEGRLRGDIATLDKSVAVLASRFDEAAKFHDFHDRLAAIEEKVARLSDR